jgi:hypothetical protein
MLRGAATWDGVALHWGAAATAVEAVYGKCGNGGAAGAAAAVVPPPHAMAVTGKTRRSQCGSWAALQKMLVRGTGLAIRVLGPAEHGGHKCLHLSVTSRSSFCLLFT